MHKTAKVLKIARSPVKEPKSILFIELSEMGATVLSYSAMKKIKEMYPHAILHFLIFKKNKVSIDPLKIIEENNIMTIREDGFINLVKDTLKFLIEARKRKIDTVLDLELFSRYSNLLSYLSGARNRVGFNLFTQEGLYRGDLQTHKVYYNPNKHTTINFLALAYALKSDINDIPLVKQEISEKEVVIPRATITREAEENIWRKLKAIAPEINKNKRIILISSGGGLLPLRALPVLKYVELVKKLLEDKNNFVILTGTKDARREALKIVEEARSEKCINLVEKTTFSELIDLLCIGNLLITNDGGPAHFASMTGIKTVVFFGPAELNYRPLGKNVVVIRKDFDCSPCLTVLNGRNSICKNNLCLKTIEVDEVYKVARELLR